MPKPVGGRGKKAPYQTTHIRIPVPLKAQIEALIDQYRDNPDSFSLAVEGSPPIDQVELPIDQVDEEGDRPGDDGDEDDYEYSDSEIIKAQALKNQELVFTIQDLRRELMQAQSSLTSLNDAIELAKGVLNQKKSASLSIATFLSELYGVKVTVDQLK